MTEHDRDPPGYWHHLGYPDRDWGPWRVTLHWQEVDERMECVGVAVDSAPGQGWPQRPQPVTSTLLRSLPIGALIRESREHVAEFFRDQLPGGRTVLTVDDGRGGRRVLGERHWRQALDATQAQRRRQYDRSHYEAVAEVYTAAWRAGDRAPTKAVQEWGEAEYGAISRSAAANWVARARGMDLLGETEQRKPGGIRREGDEA